MTLERTAPSVWRVVAPLSAEADPRAVHVLVTAVQEARVRKVISAAGAEPASYGLAPPECAATLLLDGTAGAREVRLGRTSPVGVERYAKEPTGRIVFVDGSLGSALAKSAESLREKRLVPADAGTVTRVDIDRPDGPLALAKEGERWQILSPVRDRAAASACEQLARAITTLELHDLRSISIPVPGPKDRRIAIKVTVQGRPAPIEAFVATAGVAGGRLAWRDGGAFAGLAPETAGAELSRPGDSYRDDSVATFSAPDVRSMTIERGGATIRVERAGEEAAWSAREGNGTPLVPDKRRVDGLVDSIRWLKGSGFLPSPPPTPPTGTVVVRDAAKELARLRFGPLAPSEGAKESLWIESGDRPGVVLRVPAASFGPIPSHASDLVATPAASPAPGTP